VIWDTIKEHHLLLQVFFDCFALFGVFDWLHLLSMVLKCEGKLMESL
jgi:hypothetical protein